MRSVCRVGSFSYVNDQRLSVPENLFQFDVAAASGSASMRLKIEL